MKLRAHLLRSYHACDSRQKQYLFIMLSTHNLYRPLLRTHISQGQQRRVKEHNDAQHDKDQSDGGYADSNL